MVDVPVHRADSEDESDHEPLEHRPNSGRIVNPPPRPVKAVLEADPLVVAPPGTAVLLNRFIGTYAARMRCRLCGDSAGWWRRRCADCRRLWEAWLQHRQQGMRALLEAL